MRNTIATQTNDAFLMPKRLKFCVTKNEGSSKKGDFSWICKYLKGFQHATNKHKTLSWHVRFLALVISYIWSIMRHCGGALNTTALHSFWKISVSRKSIPIFRNAYFPFWYDLTQPLWSVYIKKCMHKSYRLTVWLAKWRLLFLNECREYFESNHICHWNNYHCHLAVNPHSPQPLHYYALSPLPIPPLVNSIIFVYLPCLHPAGI